MPVTTILARLSAAIVVALAAAPPAALAAADAFLRIEGVEGQSMDPKHKGWIEVESYSLGASSASVLGKGASGGGAGKAGVHAFSITKTTDKVSAQLMLAAASGKHFKKVVLQIRKPGGDLQPYLTYTFGDVFITSFTPSGGGAHAAESVTFAFNSMTASYEAQVGPKSPVVGPPKSAVRSPPTTVMPKGRAGAAGWR
jgi:type VI secretion system Hcp family effector